MTQEFIAVLTVLELPEGEIRRCHFGDKVAAVYRVEGRVYATQDSCTHGRASLSDGYLIGDEVECPLHQGMFNVRTGAATAPPCAEPLKTYSVEVRDGVIHLADSAATAEN